MTDNLSPLAAALRDAWNSAPAYEDRWEAAATAAREHLSTSPPVVSSHANTKLIERSLARMPADIGAMAQALASRDPCEMASVGHTAAPAAAPTARPTCATCPYWNSPQGADGRWPCRRHAPRHIGSQCDDFAITAAEEWCGDHPAFPAYIAGRRAAT